MTGKPEITTWLTAKYGVDAVVIIGRMSCLESVIDTPDIRRITSSPFSGLYLTPTEITDHGSMINVCYNSECKKELRYLRDGRVVRIIHGNGDEARLEHFWLCGLCSSEYEFVFELDGSVGLKHRPGGRSAPAAA
jgi:hypothetical protein